MATMAPTERSICRAMMTQRLRRPRRCRPASPTGATCSRLAALQKARLAQRDGRGRSRQQRRRAPARSSRSRARAPRAGCGGAERSRSADARVMRRPHGRRRGRAPRARRQAGSPRGRTTARCDSAAMRPPRKTRMRSAIAITSSASSPIRMMAMPCGGQMRDDAVDLRLGADVDAARRLVEDDDAAARGSATSPAAPSAGCRRKACRSPARCRSRRRACASAKSRGDLRLPRGRRRPSMPHKPPQHRQRLVGADRELQHEALLVPVLGQERNAEPHRLARRARRDRLAVDRDLAAAPAARCRTASRRPRNGRRRPARRSRGSRPARTSKLTSSTKPAPESRGRSAPASPIFGLLLRERSARARCRSCARTDGLGRELGGRRA